MDTQQLEIKTLPHSTNKAKLMQLYLASGMTERQIRTGINLIIADSRKMPNDKAVCVKNLWHKELMEFVNTYGLPKGYKL
jgi:hypothetical protein